jgi:hypothetical protein
MLAKLLLLAIVVAAVWYAFKSAGRPRRRRGTNGARSIENMAKCSRCGVYVPTVNAVPCARDACPYLPPGRSGAA